MDSAAAVAVAVRVLESAGIEGEQAQAIAEVIHQPGADYATKADLAALEARLETTIERAKNAVMLALLGAVGVILAGVALITTLAR
ncbi:MAG: hypothetical protein F4013_03650 [Gammaproteobacteria bacterium]|nr:hypothetical protein [Gammaproteobacteria bacterium]